MNARLPGVGELAAGDRRRGDHRADRQVDAAGGDHERHPDRQHADDAAWRRTLSRLSEVRNASPSRIGAGDQQHHDDADERVLLQLDAAARQPERERAARGVGRCAHAASSGDGRRARSARRRGAGARARSRSAPSTSATSRPSRMTRIARAQPGQLRELGRDHHDAEPRGGQLADHAVDLGLGADVDAARRLVEQQHPAAAQQPAREHDLLLVAAGQLAHDPVAVVGHGVQRAQLLAARRARSAPPLSSARAARSGRGPRG